MRNAIKTALRLTFAIALLVTLGVTAKEAVASMSPFSADPCTNDSCTLGGEAACIECCQDMGGVGGICNHSGICICMY